MSMSITVSTQLDSLPDDVLRALATFVPLSDLLVLVRCSRQLYTVLQSQLNRCLNRLFVVTHLDENWAQVGMLPSFSLAHQPDQRVLRALFGEANVHGNWRVYCFVEVDRQSILNLTGSQWKYVDIVFGARATAPIDYTTYYISGKSKPARDRFAGWLRYRCEQQMATETHAYGNNTAVVSGDTSDL
jgi:hypothetical protein